MEVAFYSFKLDCGWKLYSQWVLFFFLVLAISLWGNVIVLAGPSTTTFENDLRTPPSKGVLGLSKEWRTPKKKKNRWRESENNKLKTQKGRIKKGSSSPYGPISERENWDPYSFSDNKSIHTTAPTLLRFRF